MKPMKDWFKSFLPNETRVASRRKAPPLVAYFWDGGAPVAHAVRNISSTGFYLETTERWLLGTMVMMTLQHNARNSAHADFTIVVMSKVIRYGEDGVGFSFIAVDNPGSPSPVGPVSQPADRKTLSRFLEMVNSDHAYPSFK